MSSKSLNWFVVALVGGGVLVAGCGGDSSADGGSDSGPVADGGHDAGPLADGGVDLGTGVDSGPLDGGPTPAARTLPTNGSAIVLTSDDHVLVACNRQAGSITVLNVDPTTTPPALTLNVEIAVAGMEPWAAVIGNDDDTAYVILRNTQQVVRINHLHTSPALDALHGTTGSEPTGIAISPLGGSLWVANWGEGTVTQVNTTTLATTSTVDLNASIMGTGGFPSGSPRPALAHPRAIVMTNNGDTSETDESIYVTEYYGVDRPSGVPTDDSQFDLERQGIVYRLDSTGAPQAPISIAPVASTGFLDSAGNMTGCYPNQLLAAALNGGRLYVTAVCASPRGPIGPILSAVDSSLTSGANFKTEVHTALFVIDTTTNAELPAQHVVLTQAFQSLYDAATVADDGINRRMPLIANDLTFLTGTNVTYLTGYGSDAVFRVHFNSDGTLSEVGSTAARFINLSPTGMPAAQMPYGIAIGNVATAFAFTINEHTRNVSIISLATQTAVGVATSSAVPAAGTPEASVLDGRHFFVTGLGRWSFKGQAWNSCESCHGDGLADGVTWYFARGPRQSISLDGTFDSADHTQQRLLNFSAMFDETHDFELNTRGNSGGVGAVVFASSTPPAPADRIDFDGTVPIPAGNMATPTPQAGLNGSVSTGLMPTGTVTPHSIIDNWDDVDHYIQTIRSPNKPTNLDAADVTAGEALFATNNCASCHGTTMWTNSRRFWTPGDATNNPATGLLRTTNYTAPAAFPAALNPPSAAAGRSASLRFPAGATAAANDQIQCILRFVGTFPATGTTPILPAGTTAVLHEVRSDMTTPAQGLSGFNPPSLLNLVAGAPYLHGGNARTLEEVFDPAFAAHHTALSVNFLETDTAANRAIHIRQLVAYLLSIDEHTAAPAVPVLGYNPQLCPTTLP